MARRRHRSRSNSFDNAAHERTRTKMLVASLRLSSLVKVEKEGIDLVVNACEALRKGPITVDDLWPGSAYELSSLLGSPALLADARTELDRLKDALKAVSQLRFSLSAKMHFLERSVMPAILHQGVKDLPDEVLMRILRLCHEEPNETNDHMLDFTGRQNNESLRRLALVNRRFKNLVYELPHLWSDIFYLKKSSDIVNAAALERAKHSGLHIRHTEFGNTVGTEHTNSWTTLRMHGMHLVTHKKKGLIRLPKLECLNLELRSPPYGNDSKDNALVAHFLDPFHLPRLTELYMSQVYSTDTQSVTVPISFMPQLTTLSLKKYNFLSTRDLGLLSTSLASASQLQHLTIDCNFSSSDGPDEDDFDLVHLSKLESFNFGFSIVNRPVHMYGEEIPANAVVDQLAVSLQTLLSFARCMVMPELQSFSLNTRSSIAIEDILPWERDYSRLHRLALDVPFATWKRSTEGIFRSFANLGTLELVLSDAAEHEHLGPAPAAAVGWGQANVWGAGHPPMSPAGFMTPPVLPGPPSPAGMMGPQAVPPSPPAAEKTTTVYEELPGAAEIAKLRKFVYDGSLTGRSVVKDMCAILGQEEVKLETVDLTMGGCSGDDHAAASGRFFWDDRLFQNVEGPHYFEMYW